MQWYSEFGHLTRDIMIISDQLGDPINKLALELSMSPQFDSLNLGQTRLWVFRRPE